MILLQIIGALALVAVLASATLALLIILSEARAKKQDEARRMNAPGAARDVGP